MKDNSSGNENWIKKWFKDYEDAAMLFLFLTVISAVPLGLFFSEVIASPDFTKASQFEHLRNLFLLSLSTAMPLAISLSLTVYCLVKSSQEKKQLYGH